MPDSPKNTTNARKADDAASIVRIASEVARAKEQWTRDREQLRQGLRALENRLLDFRTVLTRMHHHMKEIEERGLRIQGQVHSYEARLDGISRLTAEHDEMLPKLRGDVTASVEVQQTFTAALQDLAGLIGGDAPDVAARVPPSVIREQTAPTDDSRSTEELLESLGRRPGAPKTDLVGGGSSDEDVAKIHQEIEDDRQDRIHHRGKYKPHSKAKRKAAKAKARAQQQAKEQAKEDAP